MVAESPVSNSFLSLKFPFKVSDSEHFISWHLEDLVEYLTLLRMLSQIFMFYFFQKNPKSLHLMTR